MFRFSEALYWPCVPIPAEMDPFQPGFWFFLSTILMIPAMPSGSNLADGLVMDDIIECPKHNGQFNYKTGQATRLPACVHLNIYPVRVVDGRVHLQVSE